MMVTIGIDPGAGGAIALLTETSLFVYDMPTMKMRRGEREVRHTDASALASLLSRRLEGFSDAHAVLEKVSAMRGWGVSATFAFGRASGVIEGVLAGLGIPVSLVSPQRWQKVMSVNKGKDGARARAMQLYPKESELFARKKDDGRADAALIATYARMPKG